MKIYLVRHGQTDSNLNKVYNVIDEDINDNGINQAKVLKEKIRKIEYDIIISSPLLRAKHTAQIINAKEKEVFFGILIEKNTSNYTIGIIDLCNCKVESHFREIKKSEKGFYKKIAEIIDEMIIH